MEKNKNQDIVKGKKNNSRKQQSSDINETLRELKISPEDEQYPQQKKLTEKQIQLRDFLDSVKETAHSCFEIEELESDRSTCCICHHEKSSTDFFRSYSIEAIGTTNNKGERHLPYCKICAKKIFKYYYDKCHNVKLALHHWCQTVNMYFSDEMFERALEYHKGKDRSGTQHGRTDIVVDYMVVCGVMRIIDKTYWDSPSLKQYCDSQPYTTDDEINFIPNVVRLYPKEFENWDQEDLDNYDLVLNVYKLDPFQNEKLENRKRMYHNLACITTDDMTEDYTKSSAAIEMCRAIKRVENISLKISELEDSEDLDIKLIKDLSASRETERKAISSYGKEYGFNTKYADKNGGTGSLTGILKEMDTALFEDALANRYDVSTSVGIQQAADASWKAIFNQLNFSATEYGQVIKDQNEMVRKLQNQLDETQEKLRLANIELKKNELEKEQDNKKNDGDNHG